MKEQASFCILGLKNAGKDLLEADMGPVTAEPVQMRAETLTISDKIIYNVAICDTNVVVNKVRGMGRKEERRL